jgi:hypothetical protein
MGGGGFATNEWKNTTFVIYVGKLLACLSTKLSRLLLCNEQRTTTNAVTFRLHDGGHKWPEMPCLGVLLNKNVS